jgi:hypothetical protein
MRRLFASSSSSSAFIHGGGKQSKFGVQNDLRARQNVAADSSSASTSTSHKPHPCGLLGIGLNYPHLLRRRVPLASSALSAEALAAAWLRAPLAAELAFAAPPSPNVDDDARGDKMLATLHACAPDFSASASSSSSSSRAAVLVTPWRGEGETRLSLVSIGVYAYFRHVNARALRSLFAASPLDASSASASSTSAAPQPTVAVSLLQKSAAAAADFFKAKFGAKAHAAALQKSGGAPNNPRPTKPSSVPRSPQTPLGPLPKAAGTLQSASVAAADKAKATAAAAAAAAGRRVSTRHIPLLFLRRRIAARLGGLNLHFLFNRTHYFLVDRALSLSFVDSEFLLVSILIIVCAKTSPPRRPLRAASAHSPRPAAPAHCASRADADRATAGACCRRERSRRRKDCSAARRRDRYSFRPRLGGFETAVGRQRH